MSDYRVTKLDEAPDVLGDYPGEMRMFTGPLGAEQVAFTYRVMPPKTGGKGSYGHSHRTQEEIYFVVSGTLQFKVGDEVFDVGRRTAVRIPPETVRSVWNEGPDDVEASSCARSRPTGQDHVLTTTSGPNERLHGRQARRGARPERRLPGRDADVHRPARHRADGVHLPPDAAADGRE